MKKLNSQYVKNFIESYGCLMIGEYLGIKEKIKIQCTCGSVWEVSFGSFRAVDHSHRCPKCGILPRVDSTRLKEEDLQKFINETGYFFDVGKYVNASTPLEIIDPIGYRFVGGVYTLMLNIRHGKKVVLAFSYKNPFLLDNMRLWAKNNNKEFHILSCFVKNKRVYGVCVCDNCGEKWDYAWGSRARGRGCPCCSKNAPGKSDNFAVAYPHLLSEWDFDKNDILPEKYRPKSSKKVWWKCAQCSYRWETSIYNRVSGGGCTFCGMSGGAKKIFGYLERGCYDFCVEKEFPLLVSDSGSHLKYDFCIFDEDARPKSLIEFDGEQHFKFIKIFHETVSEFAKRKRYDKMKDTYARNNNIQLLRIRYDQIERIEEILDTFFA